MAADMIIPKGVSNSAVRQPVVSLIGTDVAGNVAQQAEQAVKEATPSRDELKSAVSELSQHFQNIQRNLNFTIDEGSGVTVVKVIDAESQEVIRQIPTEEALVLARRLSEMRSGAASGVFLHSMA